MGQQDIGYHAGFEATKAYQAEMRAVRDQDRLARQHHAVQQGSMHPRLIKRLCNGLWAMVHRRTVRPDNATSHDQPALPAQHR